MTTSALKNLPLTAGQVAQVYILSACLVVLVRLCVVALGGM
jgi:hypothetical protein